MAAEGSPIWFDTVGTPRIQRRAAEPAEETSDNAADRKVLGHAYIDTVNDERQSANLGATAFDALMIRSAIESA